MPDDPPGAFRHRSIGHAVDQLHRGLQRLQRVAKLVRQDRQEVILLLVRLGELLHLALHRFRLEAQPLFLELARVCATLLVPQLERALLQLDEHLRLGAEQLFADRLDQEVERAELVSSQHLVLGPGQAGDEDDRGRPIARAAANEPRGLEAVHAGHRDIEQDQREVLLEQMTEGLDPRAGEHQAPAERLEGRLDGDQVGRIVIDDEDVSPVPDCERLALGLDVRHAHP
jgi:hypothetical protein